MSTQIYLIVFLDHGINIPMGNLISKIPYIFEVSHPLIDVDEPIFILKLL